MCESWYSTEAKQARDKGFYEVTAVGIIIPYISREHSQANGTASQTSSPYLVLPQLDVLAPRASFVDDYNLHLVTSVDVPLSCRCKHILN